MEYTKSIYDIDKELSRVKPVSDLIDIDISEYKDIYYILCKVYKYDKHISANLESNKLSIKKDKEYQKFINFKQTLIESLKRHPTYPKDYKTVLDKATGTENIEILNCSYQQKLRFAFFEYPTSKIIFSKFISKTIDIGFGSESNYTYKKLKDYYSDYDYENNIKWYEMSLSQFIVNLNDVEAYLKPSLFKIESPEDFLKKKGAFDV